MRRQLSLDPLSARAERCVTERGARTGLTLSMSHLPEIFSTFSSFSPFSGRVSFWWTFFRPKFSGVLGFWTRFEFKQTETCSLKCTGRTNKSEFLNSCLINSKKNSSRLKFFESARDSTGWMRVYGKRLSDSFEPSSILKQIRTASNYLRPSCVHESAHDESCGHDNVLNTQADLSSFDSSNFLGVCRSLKPDDIIQSLNFWEFEIKRRYQELIWTPSILETYSWHKCTDNVKNFNTSQKT